MRNLDAKAQVLITAKRDRRSREMILHLIVPRTTQGEGSHASSLGVNGGSRANTLSKYTWRPTSQSLELLSPALLAATSASHGNTTAYDMKSRSMEKYANSPVKSADAFSPRERRLAITSVLLHKEARGG